MTTERPQNSKAEPSTPIKSSLNSHKVSPNPKLDRKDKNKDAVKALQIDKMENREAQIQNKSSTIS